MKFNDENVTWVGGYKMLANFMFEDSELNGDDKMLWILINSLSNTTEGNFCWASNAYLAKRLFCTERSIQRRLSKLEKLGHVIREIEKDENKIVTLRRLFVFRPETAYKFPREYLVKIGSNTEAFLSSLGGDAIDTNPSDAIDVDPHDAIGVYNNINNTNNINNNNIYSEQSEKAKKDNIDFNEIMTKWNAIPELANIKVLNNDRKKKIRARIKETSLEDLYKVIEKVSSSKFLLGKTGGSWKANFDWILKPDKYLAILEGNYDDNTSNRYSTTGKDFLSQAKEKENLYADWDFSDKSEEQIEFIELEE